MSDYYLLDKNNEPYEVECLVWAKWVEENRGKKHVRYTTIKKYNVEISTVFLGLDHGYPQWLGHPKNYKPVVFETMVFWNDSHELDHYQNRYQTWKQALDGHRETVRNVIKYIRDKIEKGEKVIVKKRKTVEKYMEGMLKAIDSIGEQLLDPNTPTERMKKSLLLAAKTYRESIEKED